MPTINSNETLAVRGTIDISKATSVSTKADQFPLSTIQQRADSTFPVELTELRVHDAPASSLPTTAASDDLGLIVGTFGTSALTVQTSDAKATSVTQRARMFFDMPEGFVSAGDIVLRLRSGMNTTISDGTATIDVECYALDNDGGVGSDLCTTAAISINSLSKADADFTISSSGVSGGTRLDVRITIAITDTATGTAVLGEISQVAFLLDVR